MLARLYKLPTCIIYYTYRFLLDYNYIYKFIQILEAACGVIMVIWGGFCTGYLCIYWCGSVVVVCVLLPTPCLSSFLPSSLVSTPPFLSLPPFLSPPLKLLPPFLIDVFCDWWFLFFSLNIYRSLCIFSCFFWMCVFVNPWSTSWLCPKVSNHCTLVNIKESRWWDKVA